ncbi:hypothetical protein ABW21_db0209338 [Orbilia brochopaga]|nr:hypothetical protein ABW21_db0209338 [Drechslerella brochopaga]
MATNPATTPPPASSVIIAPPEQRPSGSATTMTHFVTVGKKPDKFDPEIVLANAGDKIRELLLAFLPLPPDHHVFFFRFYPTNHSIIRGTYERPCIPYEMLNPRVDKNGAIWSDWAFVPTIKLEDEMPSFTWTVRTADQLFIYCGAPGSCNKAGMVMMINPNGSVAFELYRQAALAAPYVLAPGEAFPSDENHGPEGADPGATTTDTTPPSPTVSTISATPASESKNLTAIAGVVVGGVGALALIALLVFLFFRHRRRRRSVPPLAPHQRDLQYFSPIDTLNSPSSAGNPYFYGDKSVNLQYTSELAPTSPMLQPRGLPIHNTNMREPATRETVIISVTEEEKAMYLERLHALQTGINGNGGVSPLLTAGGSVGHSAIQRSTSSHNTPSNPLTRTQTMSRQSVHGGQSHIGQHEHRTTHAQQPVEIHEMAASRFDEEKGGMDEEMTIVDSGEGNGGERYGQVYPL